MASCWITIAQRDIGIFSPSDVMTCPLSCRYAIKRESPVYQPHALWVNFLAERVTLAKFCNQEQIDLFELMFTQTLSLKIGDSPASMAALQSTMYIGNAGFHSRNYLNCSPKINLSALYPTCRGGGGAISATILHIEHGPRRCVVR